MTPLRRRMIEDMQLRGLSARTQDSYLGAVRQLAQHYGKPPDQLTEEELRQYFLYLRNHKRVSRSTTTIALCAFKFLSEQTLKRPWPMLDFIRPPHETKLPVVLSLDEVRQVLSAIRLPHYRVCLSLIYACGLRLTEGVQLPVPQIDSARRQLHIQGGKGNTDRYVPLPQPALAMLRAHWRTHRNPIWLFPALLPVGSIPAQATSPMAVDGVQRAFRAAVKTSWLHKAATVHTLRHSWATHLFEAGVNVRIIQVWMGHNSPTTTAISTHLTQEAETQAADVIDQLLVGLL